MDEQARDFQGTEPPKAGAHPGSRAPLPGAGASGRGRGVSRPALPATLLWRRHNSLPRCYGAAIAAAQASSRALFPGHLELAARRLSPARPGPAQGLLPVSEPSSAPGPSNTRRLLGVLWWTVSHTTLICTHTHVCTQHTRIHKSHVCTHIALTCTRRAHTCMCTQHSCECTQCTHAHTQYTQCTHMHTPHTHTCIQHTCIQSTHTCTHSTYVHTCMNTQHHTPVHTLTAHTRGHTRRSA